MNIVHKKYDDLQRRLKKAGRVAVAFSGGIDSTLLLTAAVRTLGAENVLAIIARSQFFTKSEIDNAMTYCESLQVPYEVVDVDVFEIDALCNNPPDRCYICKRNIFERVVAAAENVGILAVYEGSNLDDMGDYRPGRKAVQELGVESPLLDAELTKQDIRALARELGVQDWDKPSSPCLATRFVFNEELSQERLNMVEAAERYLHGLGFKQVRVRTLNSGEGELARVELGQEDLEKLNSNVNMQDEIANKLKGFGYAQVEIDKEGYRRGSMNEL